MLRLNSKTARRCLPHLRNRIAQVNICFHGNSPYFSIKTLLGLGPQIETAGAGRPDGLLHYENNIIFRLYPLHLGMRWYWRDFGSMERWNRFEPHRQWCQRFMRNSWRHRILQPQTEKAHEGEAITKLVFRLIVGEIVERLQHQRLEDHDFIPRLASLAFRVAIAKLAFNQSRLQLWPEGFERNHRRDHCKRIALSINFHNVGSNRKNQLSHANSPRSEHENLESDLHRGGKRLFFEVPKYIGTAERTPNANAL